MGDQRTIKPFLDYAESVNRPMSIVQIGCNDGVMADPLYEFLKSRNISDNCIFVDAVKEYVELMHNHWQKDLQKIEGKRFYNVALCTLSDMEEHRKSYPESIPLRKRFYYLDPSMVTAQFYSNLDCDNPEISKDGKTNCILLGDVGLLGTFPPQNPLVHFAGIASFDRAWLEEALMTITKKSCSGSEFAGRLFGLTSEQQSKHISCKFVNCLDINSLLSMANVHEVDLLQTDLEGYDLEILSEVSKFKVKPRFIHFEYNQPFETDSRLGREIHNAGYEVVTVGGDILIRLKDAGIV